jgi:hypothetical protein
MKRDIRRLLTALSVLALAAAGLGGFMVGLAQAAHSGPALLGLAQVAARSAVPTGPVQDASSAGGPSESARPSAPGGAGSGLARSAALSGNTAGPSSSVAAGAQAQRDPATSAGAAHERIRACGSVPSGLARCHAIMNRPAGKPTFVGPQPTGYNPADLQSAYKLPSTSAGIGQMVAIVDAFDDPAAESDLQVYRSRFSLPVCTSANGCFRKVAQDGSTNFPRANGAWAQEISLDLDMVSAVCPNCHILLVEANTALLTDLLAAVDEAASLGATAISNSYGAAEFSGETSFDTHFNRPGIAITASSGDAGFGVQYPAASQYVTAVGGTSLTRSTGNVRGWSEAAWSGAGSGCSVLEPSPSWQASNPNVAGVCGRRATADVSAVADPSTGVSVYDSFNFHGSKGWLVFGGTSVSSPIIASVFALAGGVITYSASYPYAHTSSLFDVTSGGNGTCGGILCNAAPGWDGPTGLGTPNGIGGF